MDAIHALIIAGTFEQILTTPSTITRLSFYVIPMHGASCSAERINGLPLPEEFITGLVNGIAARPVENGFVIGQTIREVGIFRRRDGYPRDSSLVSLRARAGIKTFKVLPLLQSWISISVRWPFRSPARYNAKGFPAQNSSWCARFIKHIIDRGKRHMH